jgi:hypothetical protein
MEQNRDHRRPAAVHRRATTQIFDVERTIEMDTRLTNVLFIAFGAYLAIAGLIADTLVDESEGLASEERRRTEGKPTPLKRAVLVCVGLGTVVYGVTHLTR